jgi:hypothetical protein
MRMGIGIVSCSICYIGIEKRSENKRTKKNEGGRKGRGRGRGNEIRCGIRLI